MKNIFSCFLLLFCASLSFAPTADQLIISNIKMPYKDGNILQITGGSLDATIENWKEDTSLGVMIYADNDKRPLINDSIPLAKFTYAAGKLTYKGTAPLTNFQITICDKAFCLTAEKKDLNKINKNVTLELNLGRYTGKGTGNLNN